MPSVNTDPGTYTKNFVVTVVANNPQYSVTYNANAGTDTVTNMPSNVSVSSSSTGTITLSSDVPVRSGYNFLGWDTSSSATTPTYATGNTNTITLEPTQANAITLYAIWSSASRIIHDTTTTVYSPSAVPAGYTVYFDNPNIEGNPIVTADDNGKIVSFEYTNISTNGITFSTGHSLNTGIIAFDDTGFTIHLVIKMNPRNNAGKRLVSAFQQNSGSSNYSGFTFYCYSNQYFYLDASNSASITGTSFGTHINSSGWRVQNNQEQTFTLDITYTPAPNKSISVTFTPVRSGSSSFNSNDTNTMSYIPDSLSNATIILSGNGIANDTSKDLSDAVVYEFSVTKNTQ
ncbi:InlB B-repeat-containing protein [Candidatus Saccharibacteria bacterium]|nr:InlB B-repeat-containing protein [Candidatus Saccharibacteria bacterium]